MTVFGGNERLRLIMGLKALFLMLAITLGILFEAQVSHADENLEGAFPAKDSGLYARRINKNTRRMKAVGVRVSYWPRVLKKAFKKFLRREPTPAELEFQHEQLNHLVSQLILHMELSEEGILSPLPPEEDDYKAVRISGFDVIRLDRHPFELPGQLQGRILCVEGVCFFPDLFLVNSTLEVETHDLTLWGRESKKKKPSVACPKFSDKSRGPVRIPIPAPVMLHEKDRLFYVTVSRDKVHFHWNPKTRLHLESGVI